jgi:outer membrane lipoprotein SlyB
MRDQRKRYVAAAAAFTVALGGAAIGGVVGNRVGDDYDRKHPR